MEHDAWFFIGVFVFIFLIWAATGGPFHPLSFTGPYLAQPQELGGGTYLQFPRAPFGVGGTQISLPGSSDGSYSGGSTSSGGSSGSNSSNPGPLSGVPFGESSVYRGLVSMSHSVSGAGASNPRDESIQISVSQSAGVPVDLSGWTLESEATGNAVTFPKGSEVPMSGVVNSVQSVVLSPGEQAIVISGRSPIGTSFRENKCIGYYSSFQTFSPSLPQNCPTPSDELKANYEGSYIRDTACIDYVNTLSRCQAVLTPPVNVSGACQSFVLKYLNYNGCVAAHQSDVDFSGSTWRVYLGRTTSMWRSSHEVVKLLDNKGKTVDAFSY